MNGPVSKSTGSFGPGRWLSAVRTCKCAAFSLKRSTAAIGALVRIERLRRSLRNAAIDGEDDHRRQSRSAKERRHGSGRRSDILLAVERVADHAAADAAAGVEAVEHVSGLGIQSEEVVVEVAGEENAARGRGDAGDERRGRGVFPALLAGRGVERGQPAFRLFARIGGDRAAVIVHALHDRRVLRRLAENAAPIDRRNEQAVAAGIVSRPVPLHAAEQTRAAMHAFDGRQRRRHSRAW